ncbi:hypothetical protein JCM18899A_11070 [Nocardioides sp. AN3]
MFSAPRATCPACGIVLTGPDAGRLWQVDQELEALRLERLELLARLRGQRGSTTGGAASTVSGTRAAGTAGLPRFPTAPGASQPVATADGRRRSLSGQQVVLGLGALLLISAAALFTVVVWLVVGLVGQAVILASLVVTAVLGSRLFAGRRLPAAAETAAVIAVGLTLVGANAAHARGLAGLDRVAEDSYWAGALAICALLFVAFDRVVPAHDGGRGVWTYQPTAAVAVCGVPWCALAALDVSGVALQIGVGAAAAALGLAALATARTAARSCTLAAAVVLAAVALTGATVFLAVGLGLAYDAGQPAWTRWVAGALVVAGAGATRFTPVARLTPVVVTAAFALVVPAAVLEAPHVLAALGAVLAAGTSIALLRAWRQGPGATWGTWIRPLTACSVWVQVVLFAVAAGAGDDVVSTGLEAAHGGWSLVVPALGLLVVNAAGLGLFRRAGWVGAVQVALAVTAWSALVDAPAIVVFGSVLALMAAEMVLAVLIVRSADLRRWLLDDDLPRVWPLLEGLAVAAAGGYLLAACLAAVPAAAEVGTTAVDLVAGACYTAAVLVFVYAGQRGRLAVAYAGTALTSAASWLLLGQGGVTLIEAYTLPPAAMLAIVGAVTRARARREGRTIGSMVFLAPALSVALGPSTVVAVSGGDAVRVALVLAAGVACVVIGFVRRLKAPVLVGSICLAVIAVTQGGPYLSYVPGWVTIGGAGAVLLAVGVSWERAIVAGRRSTAWLASLG